MNVADRSCWFYSGREQPVTPETQEVVHALSTTIQLIRYGGWTLKQPLRASVLPFIVFLLQQVPQSIQVSYVGCVVEPHVILLQRFITELLLQPFF